MRGDFRVNTFLAIVDKLTNELKKRSVVYQEFGERFGALTKFFSLNTKELEIEGKKLVTPFKNDLIHFPMNSFILKPTSVHCRNVGTSKISPQT